MTSTVTRRDRRHAVSSPHEHRWPSLAAPKRSPLRATAARALFTQAVARLDLRVAFPDGHVIGRGDSSSPLMRILDEDAFFTRLGVDGKIGFGEAYMAGDFSTDDLPGVLTVFAERVMKLVPGRVQRLRRFYDPRKPVEEENTIAGSRDNIHRHYDLSNDLFRLFLDDTMTYSCAWFEPGDTFEQAQLRKVDGILDMARVGPGRRLLEIGTGWGTLAVRAAQRGARVTSLTISTEQKELAERRIAEAGVADRVEVQLRDYRQAQGQYDAIASVEMLEAVGEEYLPAFFSACDRLLATDGWMGLQTITMPHDRMLASRNAYSWMHKYIFPGGLIPSIEQITSILAKHTTLRITELRDIGADYAVTLAKWRERFLAHCDRVLELGFDEPFIRMWEFYLSYCQAGFSTRYVGDSQMGLARHH